MAKVAHVAAEQKPAASLPKIAGMLGVPTVRLLQKTPHEHAIVVNLMNQAASQEVDIQMLLNRLSVTDAFDGFQGYTTTVQHMRGPPANTMYLVVHIRGCVRIASHRYASSAASRFPCFINRNLPPCHAVVVSLE